MAYVPWLLAVAAVAVAHEGVQTIDDGTLPLGETDDLFGGLQTFGSFTMTSAFFELGEAGKSEANVRDLDADPGSDIENGNKARCPLGSTRRLGEEWGSRRRRTSTKQPTKQPTQQPTHQPTKQPTEEAASSSSAEPNCHEPYDFDCSCQYPSKDTCALKGSIGNSEDICAGQWHGGRPDCPDVIGSKGVFLTGFTPSKDICAKWDSDRVISGSMSCKSTGSQLVCTKAEVKHGDMTSRSSGILMMKRINCHKPDGVGAWSCATFKNGLCIDVGEEVWTHFWNDWIPDPKADARKFAMAAVSILEAVEGNGLTEIPAEHQCQDAHYLHAESSDTCRGVIGDQTRADYCLSDPSHSEGNVPVWRSSDTSHCCAFAGNKGFDSCGSNSAQCQDNPNMGCCNQSRNREYLLQDKTRTSQMLMLF